MVIQSKLVNHLKIMIEISILYKFKLKYNFDNSK